MMYAKSLWIGLVLSVLVYLQGEALWAQSACEDFQCNRSGQIMCNSDLDCTNRQPFCLNGVCQQRTCSNDGDCPSRMACDDGICESVDCQTAADCSTGNACINHRCEGCDNNAQCGERGVCQNNECVCVECRNIGHCAEDQKCSSNGECVPFCDEDKILVSRYDGDRLCRECINPATANRCNEFPGCLEIQGNFCAQGFCINRCRLDPPDFDELLDDFERITILPDPDGLPECPRCTIGFEMIGVRGVLERAGMNRPVHLRLLDSSGKVVADFGTSSPKEQSWATIPELIQPKLNQTVAIQGGGGYMLEISDRNSKKSARGAICLEPRENPLPLKRTQ